MYISFRDVQCCFFLNNQTQVVSCADDSTCKLWDISMETCIATFKAHKDYVRCGSICKQNENIFLSGSYDHNICMWDIRVDSSKKPQRVFEHENPVECIRVNNNGNMFYSGSGNTVCMWDTFGSKSKQLGSFSNHIKTVTCIDLIQNNSKIITGSIDRMIKIHDQITFDVLHSSQYISPLVSLAISRDDSRIVIGTSTGHLYVLNKDEKFMINKKINTKPLKVQHLSTDKKVYIAEKNKSVKYSRYEKLLRKFEYKAAIDDIFTPGKYPENIIISVVQEIIRQDSLHVALKNCSLSTINSIMKFITDVIRSTNQMSTLITLIDNILSLCETGNILFGSLDIDQKQIFESNLKRMHSVIEKELSVNTHSFQIIGMLGMINQLKLQNGS